MNDTNKTNKQQQQPTKQIETNLISLYTSINLSACLQDIKEKIHVFKLYASCCCCSCSSSKRKREGESGGEKMTNS